MNAILFAIAFGGVLAAAATGEPAVQPGGPDFSYGPDFAMHEPADEPFMTRSEIDGWTVSSIGGMD